MEKKSASTINQIAIKLDASSEALYKVEFISPIPGWQLFTNPVLDSSSKAEAKSKILELIKDSLLIKEGINVYLKHFIPFFSRIVSLASEEFKGLKSVVLSSVHDQVKANIRALELTYNDLHAAYSNDEGFYFSLDLDRIREICKSEIDAALFKISFGGVDDIMSFMTGKVEKYSMTSYQTYLKSIKILEYRLYSNHNVIVNLYLCHVNKVTESIK